MAKTRNGTLWHGRIFVLSLLVQNPTAADRKETAAEPAPRVATRAWRRRLAAATAALPDEILVWEIFVRLPANDVLHCRAVCRHWRGLTSATDFLLAHHRRQPSLLLVMQHSEESPDPALEGCYPVLGLDDYNGLKFYTFNDYNGFKIHASCDGLLLISLPNGSFSVCNPATRQCAPLPCLNAAADRLDTAAALYLHRPSDEYRVIYWKWRDQADHLEDAAYYIVMVGQGHSPRCIGVPPRIQKAMMACYRTAPPVVLHNCLHWERDFGDADILVFDTVAESFRLMRRPADATRLCARLCDIEGSIGFSCFDDGRTAAKIWVLQDYDREVWSFKYHVELPLKSLYNLQDAQHLVLSHKGDVLVCDHSYGNMFHCDNTGKLLESWWSMSFIIGPWFKESLVKHDFFPRQSCTWLGQPRFFQRL
ncbi:unnamed protein product [Alopecurus aequalis]